MAWNASRRPTSTTRATGRRRGLIINIQCWCSLMTSDSPGISSLLICRSCLFWPELIEDDERTRREEGAVGDPALHREPARGHQQEGDDAGEKDAEEEGGDDRRVVDAHDQADEGDQLDVAEAERVGAEEVRPDQSQDQEEETGSEAGQDALYHSQVGGEEAE